MERYSSYKDSGIQWLGEIPSSWEVVAIKNIADPNQTNSFMDGDWIESPFIQEDGIRYLTTGNVGSGYFKEQGTGHISEETFKELNCTEVFPQDILISRLNEPIGRCCIVPDLQKRIIAAVDCVIFRPQESRFSKEFLVYQMNSYQYASYTAIEARGTTMHRISRSMLGKIKLAAPSLCEQRAIVHYLNPLVSKIDEAIAQQQKMIDLLNERKQIIINNAVTKGLNPDAPMKDSGVDWIGEIPEHWEMKRLKTILSVKDKRNVDPEALLLSVYTAIGVRPRQELEERGNKASTVINYKIVSKGDLIVNRLLAWMGAYGLSNYDGVTSPDYDVYSFHADVNRGYYETLFRNTQFKSDCYKYGHGIMMMRWRTYSDEFLSINVPIPPRQEQDAIFDYLKPQIDKIEEGIEQCNRMVTLLQERKQIIINEVVTGKVKVS